MGNLSIDGARGTQGVASTAHKAVKAQNQTVTIGQEKKYDEFGKQIVKQPEGLKSVTHEIKSGDSFMSIAKHYGIKYSDVVAQLKAQGKLPKDYNPNSNEVHKSDKGILPEGKTIKLYSPKNEAQKEEYNNWMKYEKDYYQKYVNAAEAKKHKAEAPAKKSFWSRFTGN